MYVLAMPAPVHKGTVPHMMRIYRITPSKQLENVQLLPSLIISTLLIKTQIL